MEIKYYPYGQSRNSTANLATDKLFTGQRLDSTGLYYYGARYYDPEIGRFISPDSIVPNFTNPQAFNRYSYVLNNPLKYTNPSGHFAFALPFIIIPVVEITCALVAYISLNVAASNFQKADISLPEHLPSVPYTEDQEYSYTDWKGGKVHLWATGKDYSFADDAADENTSEGEQYEQNSEASPQSGPPRGPIERKTEPLGRGHSKGARYTPQNGAEQGILEKVKENPGIGSDVPTNEPMGDRRWPSENGWVKREVLGDNVIFHYVFNTITGEWDDPKFK